MQTLGRLILTLVLLTAFADLVPAIQDFLEPHRVIASVERDGDVGVQAATGAPEISKSVSQDAGQVISANDHHTGHHHDGPCVGGHCHLGHCAFIAFSIPPVRFPKLVTRYEIADSQIPTSPSLDTMKRPPRV